MKKHIITMSGFLGSGKSSTAKKIAELLGYKHASTGDFMRAMASERNITLEELSRLAEHDFSVDQAIDAYSSKIGETEENIVIDSRLAFHFIPNAFKVFLTLDPKIAAKRILADAKVNPNRHKETMEGFQNEESVIVSFTERLNSEKKRYKELYGIEDHTAPENFDMIVDTSSIPIEEVAEKIINQYKQWLNI